MTTTEPDLRTIEAEAEERLAAEAGHLEEELDELAQSGDAAVDEEPEQSPARLAIAAGFPTVAAAIMVGGVFTGVGGRVYAIVAGVLGIGLAYVLRRQRNLVGTYLLVALGLFAIGLVMVLPSGAGEVFRVSTLVKQAAKEGDVTRPPVALQPGWQALIGWLMGTIGFTAGWIALVVRRPSVALLIPLPIAAIGGISVPESQQVASGLAVLVLFAIGLGVLSSAAVVGEGEEKPSLAFELRRALRALPLIAAITAALFGLAQADILFPDPAIDPAQEPQKPKTVPLTEVEDRVLFEAKSEVTGPWRMGNLDVYDGKDWRLPPFAQSELIKIPKSGVVDPSLPKGVTAEFTVAGLGGTALPVLPNTVGIIAKGPRLAYDARNANIRLVQGQVQAGLKYTVVAAALPTVETLKTAGTPTYDDAFDTFLEIGDPPPAVVDLIASAPQGSKWEQFDFLRTHILRNVTASGTGVPKSIDAERLQDMIAGSKEGSPFEIVAAQAMLARYIGVPSRIGYGFDGGEVVEGRLQIRPKHGASFPEIYYPDFGWLPIIGVPEKAKPTVADPDLKQFDPNVLPSNEIAVQLYLPVVVQPAGVFGQQVRNVLVVALPIVLLLVLIYVLTPGVRKLLVRSRRRSAALAAGPRARVALSYAEFRDYATDLGFGYATDTPLMFLDRFVEDEEHTEYAWLVTRALWGDLQGSVTPELAATCETLSRSLRRRMGGAQPATLRLVATLSRLSLRRPYAPETDLSRKKEVERAAA